MARCGAGKATEVMVENASGLVNPKPGFPSHTNFRTTVWLLRRVFQAASGSFILLGCGGMLWNMWPMASTFDVISLCQELVRIPSINPEGQSGGDCSQLGEARLAARVAALCTELGAEVRVDEVQKGRPNVVARFATAREPDARVLLAPHLDTVGVDGMSIDPFAAEIHADRLWGRGASDTKGPMAAMLAALAGLRGELAGFSTEITFAAFMGEETGQPGSIAFAREHAGAYDFALVGEPTSLDIVHATLGCTWMDVVVRGEASHASRPDLGRNALLEASSMALGLAGNFANVMAQRHSDDLLGAPTINPGQMKAGTRANIVPDRAVLTLDMRTTPSLHRADPLDAIESFLAITHPESKFHLYEHFRCAPLLTPPDNPFLTRLCQATGGALITAPWFCDAAHLSEAGIPSVAAGPGSIEQAHTGDEWILLDDLEKGVGFYRSFLESLA